MALMNPLVVYPGTALKWPDISIGKDDVIIKGSFACEYKTKYNHWNYICGAYLYDPSFPNEIAVTWNVDVSCGFKANGELTWEALDPDPWSKSEVFLQPFTFEVKIDRDKGIWINGKQKWGHDISYGKDVDMIIPFYLPASNPSYTLKAKQIYYDLKIYKGILDVGMELVFDLQWDGYGMPWNAVNGERAELISGEIKPLHKVLRKDKSFCHIYRLDEGAKLTFPDAPAGTLEVTKTENNIVTTTQTSFSGGTLELTDKEILDAKIVDEDGNTLFQLGKKVGDSIFDAVEPTRIGTVEGNVSNVKDVGWGMVFDGVGDYVEVPDSESLDVNSAITVIAAVKPNYGYGSGLNPGIVSKRDSWGGIWVKITGKLWGRICQSDGREINLPPNSILEVNNLSYVDLLANPSDRYVREHINTMEVGKCAYDGTIRTGTDNLLIGCQLSEYFYGIISSIYIYNRALSPSEISLLTQGRYDEVSKEGLVLWVTVDPKTGEIIDRSPYRHTVTPYGGVETKLVALA